MKKLLLLSLLFFSLSAYSQDTTYTSRGYNLDYEYLCLRIDTILKITQAVSFHKGCHMFSIKSDNKYLHRNIKLKYREPLTIRDIHAEVFVHKKNAKYVYVY